MLALLRGLGLKAICLFIFFIILSCLIVDAYDPLDISGNVTIQWDVMQEDSSMYNADITIYNYQQYRHIEWPPGWRLSWEWQANEVIWQMQGAEAKEQGSCNKSLGTPPPHCCLKNPVIIDLQPQTPLTKQAANCCRGGVLTSMAQDMSKSVSHFQMSVGFISNFTMPSNFKFGTPGYTCGEAEEVVPPTKIPEDGGRRWRQALRTYRVICSYSQFRAAPAPTCCVSLSAFYSETITLCPECTCGCQGQPGLSCVKKGQTLPALPKSKDPDYAPPPLVNCTAHMCPIHVHWHIKQSYKEYWRVKITIMNLNLHKNYTSWNLAIEHPNLSHLVESFSFNYKPITMDRPINDTGMFWGIQSFNDVLMQSGENGNVQNEMLLRKVRGMFTFDAGWAFPKRVYFNGENCVMPLPADYPRLPNE
ncbi:COBRA-like protein 6 isoform X1 [Silene latifolia]|uniref:COBRA-like protein 6 isoform X1 n=1 Tax=Silene latifolia TaxID=37657 RepID=UPI003D77A89B